MSDSKTCPQCGCTAEGEEEIEEYFGFRTAAVKPQSWCKKCRKKPQGGAPVSDEIKTVEEALEETPTEFAMNFKESKTLICGWDPGEPVLNGSSENGTRLKLVTDPNFLPCTQCGRTAEQGARFRMIKKDSGEGERRHPWCRDCTNAKTKEWRREKKKRETMVKSILAILFALTMALPAEAKNFSLGALGNKWDCVAVYTVNTSSGPVAYVMFREHPTLATKIKHALGTPGRALKAASRKIRYASLFATKPGEYWLHPQETDIPW